MQVATMHLLICYAVSAVSILALVSIADGADFCSWSTKEIQCLGNEFRCVGVEKCIRRDLYCNGRDDCGDNSDEKFCKLYTCPENFFSCDAYSSTKCIPIEWKCNNYNDCTYNQLDERNCGTVNNTKQPLTNASRQGWLAAEKVKQWVYGQRNDLSAFHKWGSNGDRMASILYHTFHTFNVSRLEESQMVYETIIQFLSKISSKKLKDIPSTDIASYVNDAIAMCTNPKNFYGHDLIKELRNRVDQENYTNPNVLLALCNAGERITESDQKKLMDTFENKHRRFWTDMQAIAVMALACASKQPGNKVDLLNLEIMTLELKQQQKTDGIIVNVPTTALVMQALLAADSESDPDIFDEEKAFQAILRSQKSDGSFGDAMTTFLVAPILTCRSLVDTESNHCPNTDGDETSALEQLSRRSGPKIRVHYTVWIGNEKTLQRNLVLRVPQNTSLYGIMGIAADVDTRFKFDYTMKDTKPYISAISGIRDDPLTEKFWFLYTLENEEPKLSDESPADIIPSDDAHYVMWYRRGTWVD